MRRYLGFLLIRDGAARGWHALTMKNLVSVVSGQGSIPPSLNIVELRRMPGDDTTAVPKWREDITSRKRRQPKTRGQLPCSTANVGGEMKKIH